MHRYYAFQGNHYIFDTQTILSLLLSVFTCVERERVRNGSRERKHKSLPHRNGRQEEKAYFFISLRVILQSAFLLLESYSW